MKSSYGLRAPKHAQSASRGVHASINMFWGVYKGSVRLQNSIATMSSSSTNTTTKRKATASTTRKKKKKKKGKKELAREAREAARKERERQEVLIAELVKPGDRIIHPTDQSIHYVISIDTWVLQLQHVRIDCKLERSALRNITVENGELITTSRDGLTKQKIGLHPPRGAWRDELLSLIHI